MRRPGDGSYLLASCVRVGTPAKPRRTLGGEREKNIRKGLSFHCRPAETTAGVYFSRCTTRYFPGRKYPRANRLCVCLPCARTPDETGRSCVVFGTHAVPRRDVRVVCVCVRALVLSRAGRWRKVETAAGRASARVWCARRYGTAERCDGGGGGRDRAEPDGRAECDERVGGGRRGRAPRSSGLNGLQRRPRRRAAAAAFGYRAGRRRRRRRRWRRRCRRPVVRTGARKTATAVGVWARVGDSDGRRVEARRRWRQTCALPPGRYRVPRDNLFLLFSLFCLLFDPQRKVPGNPRWTAKFATTSWRVERFSPFSLFDVYRDVDSPHTPPTRFRDSIC